MNIQVQSIEQRLLLDKMWIFDVLTVFLKAILPTIMFLFGYSNVKKRKSVPFMRAVEENRIDFSKTKRSFMLFSSAYMNGSIILRHFGQIPGSIIFNEWSTYSKCQSKGYYTWSYDTSEHDKQCEKWLITEETQPADTFSHEMVGDLSLNWMNIIKDRGSKMILILRNPMKQLLCLKKLFPFDDDCCRNIFEQGWLNIEKYWTDGLFDLVIDSEKFLEDETYRIKIFNNLGPQYDPEFATNMTRFHGEEFLKCCGTPSNHSDESTWLSLMLYSDNSLLIRRDQMTEWEKSFMSIAQKIYNNIISHA